MGFAWDNRGRSEPRKKDTVAPPLFSCGRSYNGLRLVHAPGLWSWVLIVYAPGFWSCMLLCSAVAGRSKPSLLFNFWNLGFEIGFFNSFFQIGFFKLFLIPSFFGGVLRKVRLNMSYERVLSSFCRNIVKKGKNKEIFLNGPVWWCSRQL